MSGLYQFRPIKREEIPQFFGLILERITWMDEQGIRQWNATQYDRRYPIAYYEEKADKGELFVLEEKAGGRIAAGAVLLETDERWDDPEPSVYVHNFLSRIGCKGAGEEMLRCAQAYARQKGKTYLRLDSAKGNAKLEDYYGKFGFEEAGICREGSYEGILRQKRL